MAHGVPAPAEEKTPQAVPQTRTWVTALLLVAAVATGGAFSALVRYDLVGFGHLPRSALFICFLLLLLNLAWWRLSGRRVFGTPQLAFIYLALMAMSGFPGQQLVTYLYIGLIGAQHCATPENKYAETFFEYIPRWLVPSLDPDHPAVRWAFYGLPPGHGLPWHAWLVPLAAWTPYVLAVLLLGATAVALLRRRWADEEHMLFPLAHIPVEMLTYDGEQAGLPPIFRHWLFWLAFLVPVVLYSKNALHFYYPGIPETDLTRDIGMVFPGRPWNQLNYFPYHYYFEMIGIAYLVSDDMGLSLWFFWLFRRVGGVYREMLGRTNHAEFFEHLGVGAYTLLAGLTLHAARHSLRARFAEAWQGHAGPGEEREPMSARLMVGGFLGSLLVIVLWGQAIGANWWATLVILAIYLVSVVVLTRIVSEAGVFAVWTPFGDQERFLVRSLGTRAVGPRTITALSYLGLKLRDTASLTAANVQQGFKLGELAALRSHSVWWLMAAALATGLFASHWPSLQAIYTYTVPSLGWWPKGSANTLGSAISRLILSNQPFTVGNYGNMLLGAGTVLLLNFLRQRFLWWQLHPLGFTAMMGPQFMGDRYGYSILLGWLARKLVTRFGGYSAYTAARAAAIGMIVGNAVVLLSWTIAHYFHPISGVLIIE